jgi:hypothetical protein
MLPFPPPVLFVVGLRRLRLRRLLVTSPTSHACHDATTPCSFGHVPGVAATRRTTSCCGAGSQAPAGAVSCPTTTSRGRRFGSSTDGLCVAWRGGVACVAWLPLTVPLFPCPSGCVRAEVHTRVCVCWCVCVCKSIPLRVCVFVNCSPVCTNCVSAFSVLFKQQLPRRVVLDARVCRGWQYMYDNGALVVVLAVLLLSSLRCRAKQSNLPGLDLHLLRVLQHQDPVPLNRDATHQPVRRCQRLESHLGWVSLLFGVVVAIALSVCWRCW